MNRPAIKSTPSATLQTESPLRDLEVIIRSRMPLVAIESNEEPQIVRLVRQISRQLRITAFRWTVTEGLQAFEPANQPKDAVLKSQDILKHIKSSAPYCLYMLLDFHPYLEDSVHVRLLKDIALAYGNHYSTVVLVGCALPIPPELKPFTAYFHLPLPTPGELREIVSDAAADWCAETKASNVETTNKALDLLVRNLTGLTATDARRLARKAINDGVISESEIPDVMRAKYELLARDGILSFEYETVKFSEIGGLQRLRHWLEVRKSFFLDDNQSLDPPKGVLLLGVQGCGKSLAAKAAAAVFGVPLLRLDFGVLYNKYYGETERNLRKALETAEVMSPCVLWLDEIEKGLAVGSGGEDDGLSRRVLGTFLTWMSEHRKTVFLVATANEITRLPPELVRKGRFDEIFFVDLPSAQHRRDILTIHLTKRSLDPAQFDLAALADATDGFSGSEIEQAIVSAMYTAQAQGRTVSQTDVLNELKQTRPLSVVMAEKVAEIREWAATRTVPCD